MNTLQRYEALADEKRWEEALPVIREIIDANPEIDTSWFNCGVCLDELGRHAEAAEAFIHGLDGEAETSVKTLTKLSGANSEIADAAIHVQWIPN